jgi:glutamate synthase domain-containing protein 2/glutamate synthase domain-containing protein 1/glutamate synthase domain-containing protein 3
MSSLLLPKKQPRPEAAACGIGFLASRKGVAERAVVDIALGLCRQFDHRGAPGHGAGLLLDIPWPLLLDRFPEHTRAIAQRDVALGMFFLPEDSRERRLCVSTVEELAAEAGADLLGWADVPFNVEALPAGSSARRTAPVVRQALFRRPAGIAEDGWFACRYLLRLALDETLSETVGDGFAISSLSNRTVVYRGLAELSRVADLYPDLRDEHCASRFVLFHSRYSTNTTTAWRRAQPFWSLAHNGEIATIRGNVAWMHAIGRDLLARMGERHPGLKRIASRVRSIVCAGGSDSANLDDMLIALLAGGLSLPQSLLALLPEAPSRLEREPILSAFHEAMNVLLGACDGPAAIVSCDGDEAVAHLDRNGLRPLWITTTRDYALAASELTGTADLGKVEMQRIFGPGDTAVVRLNSGEVLLTEEVHRVVAQQRFPAPLGRIEGRSCGGRVEVAGDLGRLQVAFGMTKEDRDVVLSPLVKEGKLAVGSMGDDTPPAAMLDLQPRRLEDHFKLRFAQETSPPIDPIRDAWVFETTVALGDRSGLWNEGLGPHYVFPQRILSAGELCWLRGQDRVSVLDATFPAADGPEGLERALTAAVESGLTRVQEAAVLVLSDRVVDATRAPLPGVRLVARLHDAIVKAGLRHKVGLVADFGVWDVHHCALLVSLGADAVCPWLGSLTAGEHEESYLKGLRTGFVEAMSMIGVTPASAYCGAKLVEAVGLDRAFLEAEFPGVPGHLGGLSSEFRFRQGGRPHFNGPDAVRALQEASGYKKKARLHAPGSAEAYAEFSGLVSARDPITLLDLLRIREAAPIALEEVEPEEDVLWRFMVPGMSEGALSEPAHRSVARAMNVLRRYCLRRFQRAGRPVPPGIGPIANSGEGGFDKARIGTRDGNRSVQYAGARFTITPMTAARAAEAEVKFAQGAKPGKGGQLPGKKVSPRIAHQRGCEPGYELVSPPVNHNLYSIEDVKLMLESWRHLNPAVSCALKYVATHGVEMVALGGVNAGANRLHFSDGCGGTGAAKRVDQKHAGVPVPAVLPTVHDTLVEEGMRALVELSVDGGVQNGEQALKLFLLGADRVGFGTSVLISIGCSMLRQCHLAGPQPGDTTGTRRLGCTPGVATQDPVHVARFSGQSRNIASYLLHVAREVRQLLARMGVRRLSDVVGRRDLLERKPDLRGKAALLDVSSLVSPPPQQFKDRRYARQAQLHSPPPRVREQDGIERAMEGEVVEVSQRLTNTDRCVGVAAAGRVAREFGDAGLPAGRLVLRHKGAAGHFYAAYSLSGMEFHMQGLVADSAWSAAYGGKVVIVPQNGNGNGLAIGNGTGSGNGSGYATRDGEAGPNGRGLTLVGNTFGYGARAGRAYIRGRAGNRFGICLRKSHEGGGPRIVVEGVEANAFQYMTGGTALVLGSTGFNLGSGMTGGVVYLLDADESTLNGQYVAVSALNEADEAAVKALLREHFEETGSPIAEGLLARWDPSRFARVATCVAAETVDQAVSRVRAASGVPVSLTPAAAPL